MAIRTLGSRYLLDEQIGQGGMGVVWRGRDKVTGSPFAIKLLRSEYAADPDAVTRFVRERTVLMKFRHPAVVTLHDMIVEGDQLALVMDLVQGGDLNAYRLRSGGTLTNADAARLSAQICDGLAAAHGAGIVHRDLKPANVLLDGGQVKLADFGVARIVGDQSGTTTGTVLGTAAYLAPELLTGSQPSAACDVYAFGITMYELLAGKPPFSGHVGAIMHDHLETAPPRLPRVPDRLWDLLNSCLAKDPEKRPAAAAMAKALREPSLLALLNPSARQASKGADSPQVLGMLAAAAPVNRQFPPQSFAHGPHVAPPTDPPVTPSPVSPAVTSPRVVPSAFMQPQAPPQPQPSSPAGAPVRATAAAWPSAMQPSAAPAQVIPLHAAATAAPAPPVSPPAPDQAPAAPPAGPPTPPGPSDPSERSERSDLSSAPPTIPRPARTARKPVKRQATTSKASRGKTRSGIAGSGLANVSPAAISVAAVVVLALVATGIMALAHIGPFASAAHKSAAGTTATAGSGIVTDPAHNASPGTAGASPSPNRSGSGSGKKPAPKKSRSLPPVSASPSGSAKSGGGGGTLVPYGPDLAIDGTFSDPSLGAWNYAIEQAVISPGIGINGQNAVVLTATPQAGIAENVTGLRSGHYVLTGWVHATTSPVYIGARDDANGTEVDVSSLSSSWKKLSVNFTVPQGQSSAVIFCVQRRGGTGYCSDLAVYALRKS